MHDLLADIYSYFQSLGVWGMVIDSFIENTSYTGDLDEILADVK